MMDPRVVKKPVLGGGLSPQQWLRSQGREDRKKQANYRAYEAEAIADYIDTLEKKVATSG